MSIVAETDETWELCEKPEQNEGFWCVEESGFKYLDHRLRRHASQTGYYNYLKVTSFTMLSISV